MKKTYFFDLDGTLLPMDQDQFVHQWQLGILEFIPDILFNDLRVFSDESQI